MILPVSNSFFADNCIFLYTMEVEGGDVKMTGKDDNVRESSSGGRSFEPTQKDEPVEQPKTDKSPAPKATANITQEQADYRTSQQNANNAVTVEPQPHDPSGRQYKGKERIEFLRAKSDRTLEEGLELQELELGIEESKRINAGWTSAKVHADQERLKQKEEEARGARP